MKDIFYGDDRRMRGMRIVFALCAICILSFMGCSREESHETNLEKIAALYQKSKAKFPDVPDLSPEELMEIRSTDTIVLVDRRKRVERDVSMIPGAIADEVFESDIESFADARIVVYCTIGDRSGNYVKKLRERGMNAYNLRGGVLAWAHAGGPFIDPQGDETNRVHVYGRTWNLLPEGYVAVW